MQRDSAKSADLKQLGVGVTAASILSKENLGGARESPFGVLPFLGVCVPNGVPNSE